MRDFGRRTGGILAMAMMAGLGGCIDEPTSVGGDSTATPVPPPVIWWTSFPTSPIVRGNPATVGVASTMWPTGAWDYRFRVLWGDGYQSTQMIPRNRSSASATFSHTYG